MKKEINYNHLYRYLINGYKSLYKTNETFFKDTHKPHSLANLPSWGLYFPIKLPSQIEQNNSLSYQYIIPTVKRLLIKSVKSRLPNNQSIAFLLSGGIDSNSLIAITKKILNYPVHAFTLINTDDRYNEQELINHTISELQIPYTPIPIDNKNFISNLRTCVQYYEQPLPTISQYAHWLLMKSISESGYKTIVDGAGADELFGGYYDHHLMYLAEMKKIADSSPKVESQCMTCEKKDSEEEKHFYDSMNNWINNIKPIVRNPHLQNPFLFMDDPHFRDHIYDGSGVNAEYVTNESYKLFMTEITSSIFEESHHCDDLLRNRMLNELFYESVPPCLELAIKNANYHGLEIITPYLDQELFEFSLRIPTKYLVQNGYAKIVLRDAMRGIVPDKILDSYNKIGFNVPIMDFLNIKDKDTYEYILDDSAVYKHIRKDKIESLVNQESLTNSESKFLFSFLNVKIFLEEYDG